MGKSAKIPVTIITGFLGSGKTTLILNLIPQLPKSYKIALVKNEFGDLAVDSQLASAAAISGVRELLNGCICCNLVGQLGEAMEELRTTIKPHRIVIETSGSAFPATLALEVNKLARETGAYVLDGVIVVIDVENWKGYEDTSYTAKMQAKFTDLIVLNKWELVDERRYDEVLDRIGDLDVQVPQVKSDGGYVPEAVLLGSDGVLARNLDPEKRLKSADEEEHGHEHAHARDHQSEVEVLSVTLSPMVKGQAVDLNALEDLLLSTPRDEVYRMKAIVTADERPRSSTDDKAGPQEKLASPQQYILNWAFGRWTFTPLSSIQQVPARAKTRDEEIEPLVRMTVICARDESEKWKKKLHTGAFLKASEGDEPTLLVTRLK